MSKQLSTLFAIVFVFWSPLLFAQGVSIVPQSSSGGNVTPGTNAFTANVGNLVPDKTANKFFVAKNGSDSNTCIGGMSNACLTVGHAISLAASGLGDVITIGPGTYPENLVLSTSQNYISLLSANPGLTYENTSVSINPATGVPLTINGTASYQISGVVFQNIDATHNAAILKPSNLGSSGGLFTNDIFDANGGTQDAVLLKPNAADSFEYAPAFVHCAIGDSGSLHGLEIQNAAGPVYIGGLYMEGDEFYYDTGADIIATATSGATIMSNNVFKDLIFTDAGKATYIDFSAQTAPSGSLAIYIIINPRMATNGPVTSTHIKLGAGTAQYGTVTGIPEAVYGSNAAVAGKTFTSSTITTGGITAFTAAGNLLCSDISLQTSSTGLATGTNFEIRSNNVNGGGLICSETVANLGANITIPCSQASVKKSGAFMLEDTKTLTIDCTASSCTGAGTIRLTPNCVRLTALANAS